MNKQRHTKATRLPRVEAEFMAALENIRIQKDLSTTQLLREIERHPGASLAGKARAYAIAHIQRSGLDEEPKAYGRTHLHKALSAVRKMGSRGR